MGDVISLTSLRNARVDAIVEELVEIVESEKPTDAAIACVAVIGWLATQMTDKERIEMRTVGQWLNKLMTREPEFWDRIAEIMVRAARRPD